MEEYSKTYEIRFSDIDANRHVNYSTYIDAAGDLRYRFFAEHGYPPERLEQLGISPIYTSIKTDFLREVRMGESVTITFAVAGLSQTGMRWKARHDILKANGKKAALIDVEGVILDLATRKPVAPGPELMQVFDLCPRTPDFEILPELRRVKTTDSHR
jgi:acyl-CoA thioester hydrolase